MRRRRWGTLAILGLSITGCGKPEIVPMTPPGVAYRKVSTDVMEAEGEERTRGASRPVNVSPDSANLKEGPVPVRKEGPVPVGQPGK